MIPWSPTTNLSIFGTFVSSLGTDLSGLNPQAFVDSNFGDAIAVSFSYQTAASTSDNVESTFQFACAHYDTLLRRLAD